MLGPTSRCIALMLSAFFAVTANCGDLRIIGAGVGRTGTMSLRAALNQLGYKVYHMEDVFLNGDGHYWNKWTKGKPNASTEIIDMLSSRDYDVTTDYPACLMYKELLARYPDAKVILTSRPAVKWVKSVRSTILRAKDLIEAAHLPAVMPSLKEWVEFEPRIWEIAMHRSTQDDYDWPDTKAEITDEMLINGFERWNNEVREHVPADQLLEFHPKDGWAPLCKFLEVTDDECPKVSFPHSNSSAVLARQLDILFAIVRYWYFAIAIVGLGVYVVVRYCCCCCYGRETGTIATTTTRTKTTAESRKKQ